MIHQKKYSTSFLKGSKLKTGKTKPHKETTINLSNQNRNDRLVIELSNEAYEANTELSGTYQSNRYIAKHSQPPRTLAEETVDKGITFLERHKWLVRFLGLGVFLSITGLDLTQLIIYFW